MSLRHHRERHRDATAKVTATATPIPRRCRPRSADVTGRRACLTRTARTASRQKSNRGRTTVARRTREVTVHGPTTPRESRRGPLSSTQYTGPMGKYPDANFHSGPASLVAITITVHMALRRAWRALHWQRCVRILGDGGTIGDVRHAVEPHIAQCTVHIAYRTAMHCITAQRTGVRACQAVYRPSAIGHL